MIRTSPANLACKALLVAATAICLSACDRQEPTYETDVEDVSGGELIVGEETPGLPPVELPETPMTNVPPATPTLAPTPTPAPMPTTETPLPAE